MKYCINKKPKWQPMYWDNLREQDLKITNCYGYAFNLVEKNPDPNNTHKIQPGEISNSSLDNNTCDNIIKNIEKDNNLKLRKVTLHESLPCDHYRIAIVIDNKGDYKDYHFYRQDNDGYWSHKQGKGKVHRHDASSKLILDPENADRNYSKYDTNKDKYNYEIFCGYFSVHYSGGPFYRKI
tara:strand:- start:118 stop:660 length:543 start_codon:yes stop_codon:yes gene_type:complete